MAHRTIRQALVGAAVLVCLVLAAPGRATAQEPRPKWWYSDWAKSELGLSDQQAAEIEAVFQSLLPRLRGEKEVLDRESATLSQLMVDGATEKAIGPAIERAETARAAVSKTRTWMLVRMYRVLTPDQRVKLQAKHERRESFSGGGPPR